MLTNLVIILLALVSCARTGYKAVKIASAPRAMVVSAHPLATQAGVDILAAGGNATDAAVAVQFALAVVCPRAGNLGGGGFWITAPAGDKVQALDYREKAPGAASRDMYLDDQQEVIEGASTLGPLAAGIPGTVDGMWSAYVFGSKLKNWSALVQPAEKLAREGFKISADEADRLNRYAEDFATQNANIEYPFIKSTPWKAGDLLVQPTLANTLRNIANDGPSFFYDGAFAKTLAEEVTAAGGIWTAEDLTNYQSIWRDAIASTFGDHTIYSMPPSSSGGVVLGQMLGLLEQYDLPSIAARDSVAYYHILIEAMRRAYQDRAEYLGDPDVINVPVDSILDAAYLAEKWTTFDPEKATSSGQLLRAPQKEVYETTHTSVVDAEGNAVSCTTTLNGNYGSKYWSRTGGFFLNNEMDDFSAKPGIPNMFGLVGGEANAIAPDKRMLSSMTPTIVKRGDKTELVLGSPGGSTIITAVLQVYLNNQVHKLDLPAAVNLPRIHHQWLPDVVVHEAGAFSPEVKKALEAKGHTFRQVKSIGRVKAVSTSTAGLTGVGDPRSPDDSAAGQ